MPEDEMSDVIENTKATETVAIIKNTNADNPANFIFIHLFLIEMSFFYLENRGSRDGLYIQQTNLKLYFFLQSFRQGFLRISLPCFARSWIAISFQSKAAHRNLQRRTTESVLIMQRFNYSSALE